jgi:RNA recognition motif-containing protein
MPQILRVESLTRAATADDVGRLLSAFGEVRGVQLYADPQVGKGSVVALVHMSSDIQARRAVAALDDEKYLGRVLAVRSVDQEAPVGPRQW